MSQLRQVTYGIIIKCMKRTEFITGSTFLVNRLLITKFIIDTKAPSIIKANCHDSVHKLDKEIKVGAHIYTFAIQVQ